MTQGPMQPSVVNVASQISGRRDTLQHLCDQATPSGLLPAEEQLLLCVTKGQECKLGDGKRPAQPSPERQIRGSFLRFLGLGGDANLKVHERGIRLAGAFVQDRLDLAGTDCRFALILRNCRFMSAIVLEGAHLSHLMLDGSHIAGIQGDLAHIEGSIFLQSNTELDGGVTSEFRSDGPVRFYKTTIGGDLDCRGGSTFTGTDKAAALLVSGASIKGNVELSRCKMQGEFRLRNAHLGGYLSAFAGIFINTGKVAIDGTSVSIGGDLSFSRANIEGGLALTGASIAGAMVCSDVKTLAGLTAMRDAKIGGDLDFSSSVIGIPKDNASSLDATHATIKGTVYMNDLTSHGRIDMGEAQIEGRLVCDGCEFNAQSGDAVDFSGIKVGGILSFNRAYLSDKEFGRCVTANGGIHLAGAKIGRDLFCIGATIDGRGSYALNCRGAKIQGDVALSCAFREGDSLPFSAKGYVGFFAAEIGGNLDCSGGQFENAGLDALDCTIASIGGSVLLGQLLTADKFGPSFSAEGKVSLNYTRIGLLLQCLGGSFRNPGAVAVDASSIEVGGSVLLSKWGIPETWSKSPDVSREQLSTRLRSRTHFFSEGELKFEGARIGTNMDCRGGHFRNVSQHQDLTGNAGNALNLIDARIESTLCRGALSRDRGQSDPGPALFDGSIDLQSAHVSGFIDCDFVDNRERFPSTVVAENGNQYHSVMTIDGFTYDRLAGDSPTDAASRIAWLELQPEKHLSKEFFRPQPFDHLTRTLRAMGHGNAARRISIHKQDLLTRQTVPWVRHSAVFLLILLAGVAALASVTASAFSFALAALILLVLYRTSGLIWLGRASFGLLAGYGYSPARIVLLALLLGGSLIPVFQQAAQQGVFLPKDAAVVRDTNCGPDWVACAIYPFVPVVFSFDTMLPLKLGHAEKWTLQRKEFDLSITRSLQVHMSGSVLQALIWIEILFGWVTSGIILAQVSGLLKKD